MELYENKVLYHLSLIGFSSIDELEDFATEIGINDHPELKNITNLHNTKFILFSDDYIKFLNTINRFKNTPGLFERYLILKSIDQSKSPLAYLNTVDPNVDHDALIKIISKFNKDINKENGMNELEDFIKNNVPKQEIDFTIPLNTLKKNFYTEFNRAVRLCNEIIIN